MIVLAICAVAPSLFAQSAGGSIAGTLVDETGAAVKSALVVASKTGVPPATGNALSNANGAFFIAGLQQGAYSICVQDSSGTYLDPCDWSASPATVNLQTGQQAKGLRVTLKKGTPVFVKLNDQGKLLDLSTPAKLLPFLFLGVKTPKGLFSPAVLTSKDNSGRTYRATVPPDTALRLTIFSPQVSLTDDKGLPIAAKGADIAINQSSAANQGLTLNFSVGPAR